MIATRTCLSIARMYGVGKRGLGPSLAFGLWAYGGVIHNDYSKEQRWARLGPLGQGPTRQMAHDYTMMLIDQAEYMARFLRHGLVTALPDGGPDTWPTDPPPSASEA